MKKILFLLLAFSLSGFSPLLLAQAGPGERGQRGPGGAGNNPEQRVEQMAEVLEGLTEDQKKALIKLYTEQQEKIRAATTPEDRRALMVGMREETQEALNKILDEDQQAAWTEHLATRRQAVGQRGGARGEGAGERGARGEGRRGAN